jgi:hypothetical protein
MYVRMARFEGLDQSRIDEDVAEMKRQMGAGRSGELPDGAPDEARALMETPSAGSNSPTATREQRSPSPSAGREMRGEQMKL